MQFLPGASIVRSLSLLQGNTFALLNIQMPAPTPTHMPPPTTTTTTSSLLTADGAFLTALWSTLLTSEGLTILGIGFLLPFIIFAVYRFLVAPSIDSIRRVLVWLLSGLMRATMWSLTWIFSGMLRFLEPYVDMFLWIVIPLFFWLCIHWFGAMF